MNLRNNMYMYGTNDVIQPSMSSNVPDKIYKVSCSRDNGFPFVNHTCRVFGMFLLGWFCSHMNSTKCLLSYHDCLHSLLIRKYITIPLYFYSWHVILIEGYYRHLKLNGENEPIYYNTYICTNVVWLTRRNREVEARRIKRI